jgi:hypothetical protein
MTILGLILIPIILYFWLTKSRYLLPLGIISAVFQGASVINIEAIPISITPYYFVASLVCLSVFLKKAQSALKYQKIILRGGNTLFKGINKYMFFLAIWAAFSLFFPLLFSHLKVYVPREGLEAGPALLQFRLSNISQYIYFVENIIFMNELMHDNTFKLKTYRNIILALGIFIILIGFWNISGFYYPEGVFDSYLAEDFQLGRRQVSDFGTIRFASTFPEPSYAGSFLSSYLILATSSLFENLNIKYIFFIIPGLIALASTFSSTGYISFFLIFSIVTIALLRKYISSGLKFRIIVSIYVTLIVGIISFFLINKYDLILDALDSTVLSKSKSVSGVTRGNADTFAYGLLLQTYGFGVGIGSNRPSSFSAWISGNLGIPGAIFFALLVFLPLKKLVSLKLKDNYFAWVHITNMATMSIGIPDLAWPFLWIYFALFLREATSPKVATDLYEEHKQKLSKI